MNAAFIVSESNARNKHLKTHLNRSSTVSPQKSRCCFPGSSLPQLKNRCFQTDRSQTANRRDLVSSRSLTARRSPPALTAATAAATAANVNNTTSKQTHPSHTLFLFFVASENDASARENPRVRDFFLRLVLFVENPCLCCAVICFASRKVDIAPPNNIDVALARFFYTPLSEQNDREVVVMQHNLV